MDTQYTCINDKFYVRISNVNKNNSADSIITDSTGKFSVELEKGNYCFVEGWKNAPLQMPKDSPNEKWDTACYRSYYDECDFSLDATKDTDNIRLCYFTPWPGYMPCLKFSR